MHKNVLDQLIMRGLGDMRADDSLLNLVFE